MAGLPIRDNERLKRTILRQVYVDNLAKAEVPTRVVPPPPSPPLRGRAARRLLLLMPVLGLAVSSQYGPGAGIPRPESAVSAAPAAALFPSIAIRRSEMAVRSEAPPPHSEEATPPQAHAFQDLWHQRLLAAPRHLPNDTRGAVPQAAPTHPLAAAQVHAADRPDPAARGMRSAAAVVLEFQATAVQAWAEHGWRTAYQSHSRQPADATRASAAPSPAADGRRETERSRPTSLEAQRAGAPDEPEKKLLGKRVEERGEPRDYRALISDPQITLAALFGLEVKTIVIDAGHGGRDPGAIGPGGLLEKDVTLDIAKRLRDRLALRAGYRTLLTREDDVKISLRERVAFANANEVDLFISIHVNYLPVEPPTVIETYYFGPHADAKTLRLAEQENQDSDYSMADFKPIITKIGDTFKHQESRALAISVQNSLYQNMKRRNEKVIDTGIKTAPFVVLLGAEMPSILAEVTCISNKEEEKRLATGEYREDIARYLEEGIVAYLNEHQPHRHELDKQELEGAKRYARKYSNDEG